MKHLFQEKRRDVERVQCVWWRKDVGPGTDPGAQALPGCTQREQKHVGEAGTESKVVAASFTWFPSRSDAAERLHWKIP